MSRSSGWRRWTERRRQAVRALFKLRGEQVCTFVFDKCPECKRLWVETWADEAKHDRAYAVHMDSDSRKKHWCDACLQALGSHVSTGKDCGATDFFYAEELL